MTQNLSHLERLKSITQNFNESRGGFLLPGGVLFVLLSVRMLFAEYDPTAVENPSLMDNTGNPYWDWISVFAFLIWPILFAVNIWYNNKMGRVVKTKEQKEKEFVIALFAVLFVCGGFALDYIPVASFSMLGLVFCGMWLIFLYNAPQMKSLYVLFFILQLIALIAGPIVFVDLKPDTLNYMRHVMGLSMFVAGLGWIFCGIKLHLNLVQDLRNNSELNLNVNTENG